MKQLFETEELIGKTIKGVFDESEQHMFVTFTDGDFAIIKAVDVYHADHYVIIDDTVLDTGPNRNNYELLYKLGLINDYVYNELHSFFTQMASDEEKEAFLQKRREEIHKLQQLAQKYPEIATLK